MHDIESKYELVGAGWANASIATPNGQIKMIVSYVHDSLGELAKVLLALLEGTATQGTVHFLDEPGEWAMIVTRERDDVSIEIRWFDDWASWGLPPKNQYEVLLQAQVGFFEMCKVLWRCLEYVHQEYGTAGYKRSWIEHDFPKAELLRIRDILRNV